MAFLLGLDVGTSKLAIDLLEDEARAAATVACDFRLFERDTEPANLYDQWYNEVCVPIHVALNQMRSE